MKKLFFTLAFSLFASSAMACANFSGTYENQDSGKVYSLSQSGCGSITTTDDEATETMIIDGTYRMISDDQVASVLAAATFADNTTLVVGIQIKYKIEFPPGTDMDEVPTSVNTIYMLDSNKNLVISTIFYNGNGGVIETQRSVDRRI